MGNKSSAAPVEDGDFKIEVDVNSQMTPDGIKAIKIGDYHFSVSDASTVYWIGCACSKEEKYPHCGVVLKNVITVLQGTSSKKKYNYALAHLVPDEYAPKGHKIEIFLSKSFDEVTYRHNSYVNNGNGIKEFKVDGGQTTKPADALVRQMMHEMIII